MVERIEAIRENLSRAVGENKQQHHGHTPIFYVRLALDDLEKLHEDMVAEAEDLRRQAITNLSESERKRIETIHDLVERRSELDRAFKLGEIARGDYINAIQDLMSGVEVHIHNSGQ